MELTMRVIMKKERNMVKDYQYLLMVLDMKVNLITMTSMAREYMCGVTTDDMRGIGKEIKCMEKEKLLGLMGDPMKESN